MNWSKRDAKPTRREWGYDTEYAIIVAELWDLEEDILRDPGALESQLVRVR